MQTFTISQASPLKAVRLAGRSQGQKKHGAMLSLCARPITRQTAKLAT